MLTKLRTLLTGVENRKTFFARIERFFTKSDDRYIRIEYAYDKIKAVFKEQFRDDGDRFFEHLRGTALILIDYLGIEDPDMIIAALAHDIVEEIDGWTIEMVSHHFGRGVSDIVEWVTKLPVEKFPSKKERNLAFYERFQNAPRNPIIIKSCDHTQNLFTMYVWKKGRIRKKIEETKTWYLPLFQRELVLFHEIEELMEILLKGENPLAINR